MPKEITDKYITPCDDCPEARGGCPLFGLYDSRPKTPTDVLASKEVTSGAIDFEDIGPKTKQLVGHCHFGHTGKHSAPRRGGVIVMICEN